MLCCVVWWCMGNVDFKNRVSNSLQGMEYGQRVSNSVGQLGTMAREGMYDLFCVDTRMKVGHNKCEL